jgi:ABC-2 type transport system ATP-binding protein
VTQPSIQAVDLSYSYGRQLAVDHIGFQVAPGEVLGFLGPNGAGKSTTIKMLTGQLRPATGSASVLGLDVSRETARAQARIGVVFEEKNLYEGLTAAENLDFFARLFGIRHYDSAAALQRVGLAERAGDRVKAYSKGMRQRLMVARALVNSPDVLFLDEPTDGLDPVSAQAIRQIVRDEAARGAAVFLTTHDMHEADDLSHRVAFLIDGRIAAMDTPEELKQHYGRRSVRVRVREGGEVRDVEVALDDPTAGDKLRQAVAAEGLLTIHTEEATLEDIFIRVTGRGLA